MAATGGQRTSAGEGEETLRMHSGDSGMTLGLLTATQPYALKIVRMINFMLCFTVTVLKLKKKKKRLHNGSTNLEKAYTCMV